MEIDERIKHLEELVEIYKDAYTTLKESNSLMREIIVDQLHPRFIVEAGKTTNAGQIINKEKHHGRNQDE